MLTRWIPPLCLLAATVGVLNSLPLSEALGSQGDILLVQSPPLQQPSQKPQPGILQSVPGQTQVAHGIIQSKSGPVQIRLSSSLQPDASHDRSPQLSLPERDDPVTMRAVESRGTEVQSLLPFDPMANTLMAQGGAEPVQDVPGLIVEQGLAPSILVNQFAASLRLTIIMRGSETAHGASNLPSPAAL